MSELNPDFESEERLRSYFQRQQNLVVAVLMGSAAAVISAGIWAVVTVITEYQIGWMAIGVGFLVGFAVRVGKGIDKIYGIIGAILALFGCLLGNALSIIGFIAKEEAMNPFAVLTMIDFTQFPQFMIETGSPMDLLFYGLAVYQGYHFSFRKISPEEAASAQIAA